MLILPDTPGDVSTFLITYLNGYSMLYYFRETRIETNAVSRKTT